MSKKSVKVSLVIPIFLVVEGLICYYLGLEATTLVASFVAILSVLIGWIQINDANDNFVEQNMPALTIVDKLEAKIIPVQAQEYRMNIPFDIENCNPYHAKELEMYYDLESIVVVDNHMLCDGPKFKGTYNMCRTPSKSLFSILGSFNIKFDNFMLTYVFDVHMCYAGVKNNKYISSSKIIGHIFFNKNRNGSECSSAAFYEDSDTIYCVSSDDDQTLIDFKEKYKKHLDENTQVFNKEIEEYERIKSEKRRE